MKKIRYLAFLLMVSLCITYFPAASASTIVLTAANDQFLPLASSTMPVRRSGEWYVPFTSFGSFPISTSMQEDGDLLVLQNDSTSLSFSLSQSYVYDQNMTSYAQPAYQINGQVYVPVKLVCGLFGLSYSLISGDYQVLRICDDNAGLSDHVFITQMAGEAQGLVNTYKGINTPVKPTAPPVPEDTSPEVAPPEKPIEPAAIRPSLIYLAFLGAPTEYSADLLDTLSVYARKATFFLPVGQKWDADFVRRLLSEGHAVGLQMTLEQVDDSTLLSQSNQLLFEMAGVSTRLVTVDGGSDKLSNTQRDAMIAAGYRLWDATVTADDHTHRAVQVANLMLKSFDGTTAVTVLGMHHTRSTNAALTIILRDLRANGIKTSVVTVADSAINLAGEIR